MERSRAPLSSLEKKEFKESEGAKEKRAFKSPASLHPVLLFLLLLLLLIPSNLAGSSLPRCEIGHFRQAARSNEREGEQGGPIANSGRAASAVPAPLAALQ